MKRITAIILSAVMLLCAAFAGAESSQEKVTIGTLSINGEFTLQCGIPEGYTLRPIEVGADHVYAALISEDPQAPVMQVSVVYDEQYSDVERLNDLDQEALELLEETYIVDDPEVEITYGETGYGTLLLIARHETDTLDFITFFSIYKGYCVEFALVPGQNAEDKNLTDDQLGICVDFLTEMDFVPGIIPMNNKMAVAGLKFVTNLSDYNPETNTLTAEVMHGVPLPEAQAEALKAGDTLTAGRFETEITSISTEEDGYILINDGIELRRYGDEYHIYIDNEEYIETYMTLELEVPDALTFEDGIDRETGEPVDQPIRYGAEEFRAMLEADDAPGFASNNVWVTFDEQGDMLIVEREYSEAQ